MPSHAPKGASIDARFALARGTKLRSITRAQARARAVKIKTARARAKAKVRATRVRKVSSRRIRVSHQSELNGVHRMW